MMNILLKKSEFTALMTDRSGGSTVARSLWKIYSPGGVVSLGYQMVNWL